MSRKSDGSSVVSKGKKVYLTKEGVRKNPFLWIFT